MGRAWAVGTVAALLAMLLFESALAWVSATGSVVLPALLLLLSYVVIGTAAGHAAVSLAGDPSRAWPAVLVVALAGASLLGWGHGSAVLHPTLTPLLAALGSGACTAAGGWLGLVLPNVHRSAAPAAVLANQPTVELRILPSALIATAVAGRGASSGRRHAPPPPRRGPAALSTAVGSAPTRSVRDQTSYSTGPDILDFGT